MKLGELINSYHRIKGVSMRDIAKEIGISHGTLHRIEKGDACDIDTFFKVMLWIMKPTESQPNGR